MTDRKHCDQCDKIIQSKPFMRLKEGIKDYDSAMEEYWNNEVEFCSYQCLTKYAMKQRDIEQESKGIP